MQPVLTLQSIKISNLRDELPTHIRLIACVICVERFCLYIRYVQTSASIELSSYLLLVRETDSPAPKLTLLVNVNGTVLRWVC